MFYFFLQLYIYIYNGLFIRFPSQESLFTIYSSILTQHLKHPPNKFNATVTRLADLIVQVAINFHNKIQTIFLPTAIKFHYLFNLRDMSNVFQVKYSSIYNKLAKNLTIDINIVIILFGL